MLELKAKPREMLGKKVKTLRQEGFLPAVVYGEKTAAEPISVPYKDFERIYREAGESTLVKLDLEGKPQTVLIHEAARDPLKDSFIHADFYAVRMDKTLKVKVPLEFVGESPAVENENGILVKVMHEAEIEALPQDLPHRIEADLSRLETLESKIFLRDLTLPKGVKFTGEEGEIVVLVEPPRTEEELKAELETAPEAAPAEVKTEREAKAEVEAEEKTEAGEEVEKETPEGGAGPSKQI